MEVRKCPPREKPDSEIWELSSEYVVSRRSEWDLKIAEVAVGEFLRWN